MQGTNAAARVEAGSRAQTKSSSAAGPNQERGEVLPESRVGPGKNSRAVGAAPYQGRLRSKLVMHSRQTEKTCHWGQIGIGGQ